MSNTEPFFVIFFWPEIALRDLSKNVKIAKKGGFSTVLLFQGNFLIFSRKCSLFEGGPLFGGFSFLGNCNSFLDGNGSSSCVKIAFKIGMGHFLTAISLQGNFTLKHDFTNFGFHSNSGNFYLLKSEFVAFTHFLLEKEFSPKSPSGGWQFISEISSKHFSFFCFTWNFGHFAPFF